MKEHIIFFDDQCSFCNQCVLLALKLDKRKRFFFSSLRGQTASRLLTESYLKENSLVLLENRGKNKNKIWMRGKAVLRIVWLLGGSWRLLGWVVFVPFGADILYRIVAMRRHKIAGTNTTAIFEEYTDRFLL
jgi:predicted DCC family thiol-disulfide oxidoreductase YuxK